MNQFFCSLYSSSRRDTPSVRLPEENDTFFVKPPDPKSQEFAQMSELFSTLPKKHRKELATHIGYGEKRKHKHRPSDIRIPSPIIEVSEAEKTYDPLQFTTIQSYEFPLNPRKR